MNDPRPYDLNARMNAPRRGQPAVVPVECYEREHHDEGLTDCYCEGAEDILDHINAAITQLRQEEANG